MITTTADQVRKGDYIIIKECPCRIFDTSRCRSKPLFHLQGSDIRTGKKVEDIYRGGATLEVLTSKRAEYRVLYFGLTDDPKVVHCMIDRDGIQEIPVTGIIQDFDIIAWKAGAAIYLTIDSVLEHDIVLCRRIQWPGGS